MGRMTRIHFRSAPLGRPGAASAGFGSRRMAAVVPWPRPAEPRGSGPRSGPGRRLGDAPPSWPRAQPRGKPRASDWASSGAGGAAALVTARLGVNRRDRG